MNREEAKSLYDSLDENEQLCVQALKTSEWSSGIEIDHLDYVSGIEHIDNTESAFNSLMSKSLAEKVSKTGKWPNIQYIVDENGDRHRLTKEFYDAIHEDDIFDPEEE